MKAEDLTSRSFDEQLQRAAGAVERHHDQWHNGAMAECANHACALHRALGAVLAEAQRERDALVRGITDLLYEISGDDYLAGSSLPLPALAAVVRRQVAALAEAQRALEGLRALANNKQEKK